MMVTILSTFGIAYYISLQLNKSKAEVKMILNPFIITSKAYSVISLVYDFRPSGSYFDDDHRNGFAYSPCRAS